MRNAYLIGGIGMWISTKKFTQSLKYIFQAMFTDLSNFLYILLTFPSYVLFFSLPLQLQEKIRGRQWYGIQGVAGGPQKVKSTTKTICLSFGFTTPPYFLFRFY